MNSSGLHQTPERNAPKSTVPESRPRKFHPFYESVTAPLPGPPSLIWKVIVSVVLGLIFLALFLGTGGTDIFKNSLWLLTLMITTSLLTLYYATDTLRRLFPAMDSRLHERGKPFSRDHQTYYQTVRKRLSNLNFVLAGLFFGILNCAMAFVFGIPATLSAATRWSMFAAFFVVGFICGMAALGIYGVVETIKDFVKAPQLELDYSAPDGCGGMRFLGEALIKFGSVTLIMGVLIAIFMVNFDWEGREKWWVAALRWFWIAFPFALSLIVVLSPSAEISGVLDDYKVQCQDELDERLADLRKDAKDPHAEANAREAARKDYDYFSKQREAVYNMSTWPYGVGSSVKYVAIVMANAGTLFASAAKTIIERALK